MSSSFMLKGPISSDSRAPPSGLKSFSLLGNGWRELCNHNETLLTCWERALHRIGSVRSTAPGCLASRPGTPRRAWWCWSEAALRNTTEASSSPFVFPPYPSLMRTSVYKCYHLSPPPPSWRREWRFYNSICVRVSIKKALCINLKVIEVRTPKKILVSVQSLRKIF